MAATNDRTVTVFGGTGFLGRRVVRHLRKREFSVRIASRHLDRGHRLFGLDDPQLQSVEANIHDERSVADALAGAYGMVNAVSLYVEHGQETFHSVHVESAQRVAAQAHRAGVERVAHVSGIGADALSQSLYIRKRGEGELAVRTLPARLQFCIAEAKLETKRPPIKIGRPSAAERSFIARDVSPPRRSGGGAICCEARLRLSESGSPPSLREEQSMHTPMHLKPHHDV
jgi:NAD(P)H-binding